MVVGPGSSPVGATGWNGNGMNSSQCGASTGTGGRCTQPVATAGRCAAGHPAGSRHSTATIGASGVAVAAHDPMTGAAGGLAPDQIGDRLDAAVAMIEGSTDGKWVCDDYDRTAADCLQTLDALAPLDGQVGKDSVPTGLTCDALAGLTIRELVQQAHLNLTNAAQRVRRDGFAEDRDAQERVVWERNRAKAFLTAAVIAEAAYADGSRPGRMGGATDGGGWTNGGEIATSAGRALGRPATDGETEQWATRLADCGVTIRS